ncbi:MAG TPA: hypothetical protein VMV20_00335 [Chitinophagaceae bacterium]|nr:hypothetical protein [Chitinophagaceae bacterium]
MEYFSIGHFGAPHGLQGEIKFIHRFQGNPLATAKAVFLNLREGQMLPYFLQGSRKAGTGTLLVRLEEVGSRNLARPLTGLEVYLDRGSYYQLARDGSPNSWLDFDLFEAKKGLLGKISEVRQEGGQTLALVEAEQGPILVPLHPDLVVGLDASLRQVRIALPEDFSPGG